MGQSKGDTPMPEPKTVDSTVFKAPPRRLRMPRPPGTPPPAPKRPSKATPKKS